MKDLANYKTITIETLKNDLYTESKDAKVYITLGDKKDQDLYFYFFEDGEYIKIFENEKGNVIDFGGGCQFRFENAEYSEYYRLHRLTSTTGMILTIDKIGYR